MSFSIEDARLTRKQLDAWLDVQLQQYDAENGKTSQFQTPHEQQEAEIPRKRRRRSIVEVNAEAIFTEDGQRLQYPQVVQAFPVATTYGVVANSQHTVETVALHLIFTDLVLKPTKLAWLPSYSSGSSPTDVCSYPDITISLTHIAQRHKRAVDGASACLCRHLYILVTNTKRERNAMDTDEEWSFEKVETMCESVAKALSSGQATPAIIRAIRAGTPSWNEPDRDARAV